MFFANTIPAISRKKLLYEKEYGFTRFDHASVDDVEEIGKTDLYDIQTGTGNFIAEGLVSHNCYLKGTFRFSAFPRKDRRVPPKFKPRPKIEKAVKSFINCMKHPAVLNTGELGESLMGENQKPPFSEFIVTLLKDTPHKVLFLAKGTYVKNFIKNNWQKNMILSWSINSPKVARRYEKGAPNPLSRIEAARLCYEAGYRVRFRLDPMVPVDPPTLNTPLLKTTEEWREEYSGIVGAMFDRIRPERITLGTLRGLPATLAVAVNKEWTKYLDEKSNWGRKPSLLTRFNMFKFAIKQIRKQSGGRRVKIGICKETQQLHKMLEKEIGYMNYRRMECNCL